MTEHISSPLFFVSYARADIEYEKNRAKLRQFVADLAAQIAIKIGVRAEGTYFFDETSLENGVIWTSKLAEALRTCRIGLALYSPSYFTSNWCGKEFQVFLNRRRLAAAMSETAPGIVPVWWVRCTTLPPSVHNIQYKDDSFPQEYAQMGVQQLLSLKVYSDQYEMTLEAIAESIVTTAHTNMLAEVASLDLDNTPSAWDRSVTSDPDSHKEGAIGKTCFIYASKAGWDWQPYPETGRTVGAMAQELSGQLGLRYEEIPCDAELARKLKETRTSNVPTVLLGDPTSLLDKAFEPPMREYDDLYLLNCGALVPWSQDSRATGANDERWRHLRANLFPQKTSVPPPFHEWRSIFSQADLELKTRLTIEKLRLRLLDQILTPNGGATAAADAQDTDTSPGGGTPILRADDKSLVDLAASHGIRIDSAPQIEGPTR